MLLHIQTFFNSAKPLCQYHNSRIYSEIKWRNKSRKKKKMSRGGNGKDFLAASRCIDSFLHHWCTKEAFLYHLSTFFIRFHFFFSLDNFDFSMALDTMFQLSDERWSTTTTPTINLYIMQRRKKCTWSRYRSKSRV